MDDSTLHDLLKNADAPARVNGLDDLPACVLRRRAQRRAIRVSASLLLLLAAATCAVVLIERPRRSSPSVQRGEPVPTTAQFAFAESDVDVHLRTAALLTTIETTRAKTIKANQRSDQREQVLLAMGRQRERAAMTLLHQAERLSGDPSRAGDAAAQYRHAIELFPDTPAAAVAQRRLDQIKG